MMTTEECHPEEMQAGCPTSRLWRRGGFTFTPSSRYSVTPILCDPERSRGTCCSRRARPDCRVHFTHEGAPSKLRLGGGSPAERIRLPHPNVEKHDVRMGHPP